MGDLMPAVMVYGLDGVGIGGAMVRTRNAVPRRASYTRGADAPNTCAPVRLFGPVKERLSAILQVQTFSDTSHTV